MNLRVSKLKLFQPSFFSQKSQTKIVSTVIFSKKAWKEFWYGRNGQILKTWWRWRLRNLITSNKPNGPLKAPLVFEWGSMNQSLGWCEMVICLIDDEWFCDVWKVGWICGCSVLDFVGVGWLIGWLLISGGCLLWQWCFSFWTCLLSLLIEFNLVNVC